LGLGLFHHDIQTRRLERGGFADQVGGPYRPDSTAWAVLALRSCGYPLDRLAADQSTIAASQREDGRVCFAEEPTAFWPTSSALLAWHRSDRHQDSLDRAVKFLLKTTGKHSETNADSPVAHDSSILGWPWTEDTHSWIEPTALALIALEVAGHKEHPRFREGIRMIMDRQLRLGGWNYGNTMVYGKELRPFVDTTGLALTALAGHVDKREIGLSILFLQQRVERCRTPLSLGWALSGLGAWGEFPPEGRAWIKETLERQTVFGPFGTTLLSLLALVYVQEGDIRKGLITT